MFEPPITINGMCYALKRETLHDLGGFEPLLKHLTDDLAIARLVRQRGGRLRQTPYPQEVETQLRDTPHYVQQMHRWFLFATLLVRSEPPASALRIGLLQGLHPLLLWATCLGILLQPSPLAVGSLGVLLAIRAAVICGLQQRFTGRVQFNLFLSLLSELLQPLHLLHAACVRSIRWRSRRYRVYDNDRFESR
jgi:ceramide glucosyltransferase